MVAANPVTDRERRFARLMAGDQERTVRLATAGVIKKLQAAFSKVLRAYRQGQSVDTVLYQEILALADMFGLAMTVAHLQGIVRTQEQAPLRFSLSGAQAFLRRRMGLSTAQTRALTARYTAAASTVVPRLAATASRRLQDTMLVITAKNLHVREGVKLLKADFVRFGLSPGNPYAVEAVFRTQMALAYSAGRYAQEQAPEIQAILWGYKYVTVGDDRVRDSHAGYDGTTLPKDDDFWDEATPPNGWACRCQTIAIFDEGRARGPKTIDGVEPRPDRGFDFHPGRVLKARARSVITPKLPKPKRPPVIPKKVTTLPEPAAKPKAPEGAWDPKVADKDLAGHFNNAFGTQQISAGRVPDKIAAKAIREIGDSFEDLKTRFFSVNDSLSSGKGAGMLERVDLLSGSATEGAWFAKEGLIEITLNLDRPVTKSILRISSPTKQAFSVDQSLAGVSRHELGHMLADMEVGWHRLYAKQSKDYWKKSVSEYGAANHRELAAEAFSAWTHPGYAATAKKLPKAVEELLERTVGRPNA